MIKILFVCHGNICRSPMAHLYFEAMADREGLGSRVFVDSAATSFEEIGNPVHPGTRRKLSEAGISCAGKRARHMEREDYRVFDYLIGMDQWNIKNMQRIAGGDPEGKIFKMLEFAGNGWKQVYRGKRSPQSVRDVADPWYTGNFDDTWTDVTEGCTGLLAFLRQTYGF